ncbi:MAG: phosphotransferase family protein, partial [Candidatus Thorarchaeota archaeon]
MPKENLPEYLIHRCPDWKNLKILNLQNITSGWETEILSFDAQYTLHGDDRVDHLIARIYPGSPGAYRANFEYTLLRDLHDLGFPVPRVLLVDVDSNVFDRPFIIMDRIVGKTLMEHMLDGSAERYAESIRLFCRVFVQLHKIDWKKISLVPESYLTSDFPTLFRNHLNGSRNHAIDNGVPYLTTIVTWLENHLNEIEPLPLSLLHRDFHPSNILLDESGNPYVIDWTAATIGDPRMDIAWSLLLAKLHFNEDLADVILSGYEEVIGKQLENMDFFIVDACLRRLSDITIMLHKGAEELGMREATTGAIKEGIHLLLTMQDMVYRRTGLKIDE